MSFNFTGVQSMSIPEGVATKITDASGRVLWQPGGEIVLMAEKITSNTYAAETLYENEQFILLDIYPETNGAVTVTYGGLTKTITDTSGAEEPNAQQVFFGTFNGVSDSVTTPNSGELVIKGNYRRFTTGLYASSEKNTSAYCGCITDVVEWGKMEHVIPDSAFYSCTNLALTSLPSGLTSIGNSAFYSCTNLALTSLPSGLTSIGNSAFYSCVKLSFGDDFFKHGLTHIGNNAFNLDQYGDIVGDDDEDNLSKAFRHSLVVTIPATVTTIGADAFGGPIIEAHSWSYFYRVTVLATTPPSYPSDTSYEMFSEVINFSIIVPKGCGEAYKAADGWSVYANYIVEAS